MTDILESLQRKLQGAIAPTVARHAVAGIFATLKKPGISADSISGAIALCLSHPNKAIVQEASDQLLALTSTGGLPHAEAVDFLLSAITTAGPATAAPLADALCRLTVRPASSGSSGGQGAAPPAPPAPSPGRWTSHPLVSSLLSGPAAATQLLTSAMGALTSAATTAATAGAAGAGFAAPASTVTAAWVAATALEGTWASLESFFSFVLLQRHSAAGGTADRTAPPSSSSASASGPAASAASSTTSLATCALAAWLHGQIVRLACSDLPGPQPGAEYPTFRLRLLTFLIAHLTLGPRGAEVDRMHAVQSTVDTLDVLEAALYDSEEATAQQYDTTAAAAAVAVAAAQLADVLLQLAFEVLVGPPGGPGGGGGGGGAQVVAALLRLQSLVPYVLTGHVATLAFLTLFASGKELQGLHLLLHKALQNPASSLPLIPSSSQRPASGSTAAAAVGLATATLSLQPLLSSVAFGTAAPSDPAAAWPAHLALALQNVMQQLTPDSSPSGSGTDGSYAYGDLCLHRQCRQLLLSLWAATDGSTGGGDGGGTAAPPPCDLRRWLRSLELALRQRRRAAAAAKAASEQLPFATRIADVVSEGAMGAADAHPAVTCLVAALLAHTDPRVRAAAAATARQLVLLLPAAALPLLPLVMYQLQRGGAAAAVAAGGAPGADGSAAVSAQLTLLQLLPVMAADPSVAPYALRVLQPMLLPEVPERLRCLGLKLVCDTWLLSGRGWPQVEAALNGLTPPGARDPAPCLRVTRAALVRAVCDRDPGRGVELVSALQQCICDSLCPPAAALGLEALAVLVEEDVLDFYTAYKVVHRWHPGLPADPLVASRWVGVLSHGSLDAEAYPDKAAAILDVLWSAARHPNGVVRGAAYAAISRYSLEVLERLEILRPLIQYTGPLLVETDPRVCRAARQLAAVALRFEHANRRRLLLTQPTADGTAAGTDAASAAGGAGEGSAGAADSTDGPAAGAGGASGTRSKGAAFAAAATAREARALRGRLLGRIPKQLLAGSGASRPIAGGAAAAAANTGSFHPGAVLFCYVRPPPPPLPASASAAAVAAAMKRAAAESREAYGQRLRDGLRRLGWRGPWHVRLAVQAWAAFVRRWMYDTGLAAAEAASTLAAEWNGTAQNPAGGRGAPAAAGAVAAASAGSAGGAGGSAPAAVLEGVGLAAGALCVAAEGLREADVSALVTQLLQQAQSGRSSGITRGSLLGAALAATRLHPTDWAARQQVLTEIRVQLLTAATAVVRSAAATAVGVLAGSLAADPAVYIRTGAGADADGTDSDGHSREYVAVAEALSYLTTTLGTLCPPLAPALAELACSGLPADWPRQQVAESYSAAPKPLKDELDEQEVLPGTAAALASLLCDVNRAHGLPQGSLRNLLMELVKVAAAAGAAISEAAGAAGPAEGSLGRRRNCSQTAAATAALEAAAVLAPEALRYQQLSIEDLSYTLTTVRQLCSGAVADGRLRGAAGFCLGCVAVAALRQGMLTWQIVLPEGGLAAPAGQAADVAAMSVLVTELAEQAVSSGAATPGPETAAAAAVVVGGGKGQYTAAARTGAVAGLAAVLLPPPPSLVDALAPIPPGAVSSGLLAQPEYLAPAKAATKVLESLATEDADPWVSAAAAFHLASVAAAVAAAEGVDDATGPSAAGGGVEGVMAGDGGAARGNGAGTGGAGGRVGGLGGPKALSLYPPEGAVRPVVTALMDRPRLAALPRAALADTLLALAAAPALPAADWPTAGRTLLATASSAPTSGAAAPPGGTPDLRLQAATLLLALSHGSVPSLGLGTLLEELVAPVRFAALDPAVQALLLARLPALLRSLAAKRAAAVVQSLPGLVTTAVAARAAAGRAGGGGYDGADGDGVPWASPAGLDDPAMMLMWLRRVQQAVKPYGSMHSSGHHAAGWLASHCWLGLMGVCRSWQAKDPVLTHRDITQATHTALAALALQLPPLPALQPGEASQLLAWAAAPHSSKSSTSAGSGGANRAEDDDWETYGPCGRPLEWSEGPDGGAEEDGAAASPAAAAAVAALDSAVSSSSAADGAGGAARAAVTLWSLAACCLRCLRPDFLTAQVLAEPPAALTSLQLRCVLVATGHVSYRELMPVRSAVSSGPALSYGGLAGGTTEGATGDPLMALLSLALAGTPQAFQVQVLLQTLDGARVAEQQHNHQHHPHSHSSQQLEASLQLAAALVAACLSHAAGAPPATAPELCLALTSRSAALRCLPYTLPRLLSRAPWNSSGEAVAQALLAIAREGLKRERGMGSAAGAGAVGTGATWSKGVVVGEAMGVLLACLWGLRDMLPPYTYDQMHSALGWEVLARVVGPPPA